MRDRILRSMQLIKHFKFRSIFFKNLKTFTLIIILPIMLIVSVLSFYYRLSITHNAQTIARQNHSKVSQVTEKILEETEQMYLLWVTDEDMTNFFSAAENWNKQLRYLHSINEINSFIESYTNVSEYIDSVEVYSDSAEYVLSSTDTNKYISDYKNILLLRTESEELSYIASVDKSGMSSYSVCYNVIEGRDIVGSIIFNINPRVYKDVIFDAGITGYSVKLLDRARMPVFSIGEERDFSPDFDPDKDNVLIQKGNEIRVTSSVNGFWIYTNIEFDQMVPSTLMLILFCVVMSLLISLIISAIIALKSYMLWDDLIFAVNCISPSDELSSDTTNEIDFIRKRLITDCDDRETYAKLIGNFSTLKNLQINMLQTQFTPHFLFNALQALNWHIAHECGIDNPANELISIISDLLAVSLDWSNHLVAIEDELKYSEKYLKISSIMNKNNFDVVWNVDEKLLNYKTLKLSLQPILENALKHGIKKLRNRMRGYLEISVFEDKDETIVFEVKNNGEKADKEYLDLVQRELDNGSISFNQQIGLRNVNKRIKLIFGDEYGCFISSDDEFTIVQIKISKLI